MKVSIPSRKYKYYCFISDQIDLEREPKWLIGADDTVPVGRRVHLSKTVYAGIYGFSDIDKRDRFVRQCNSSNKLHEIAFICSLLKE